MASPTEPSHRGRDRYRAAAGMSPRNAFKVRASLQCGRPRRSLVVARRVHHRRGRGDRRPRRNPTRRPARSEAARLGDRLRDDPARPCRQLVRNLCRLGPQGSGALGAFTGLLEPVPRGSDRVRGFAGRVRSRLPGRIADQARRDDVEAERQARRGLVRAGGARFRVDRTRIGCPARGTTAASLTQPRMLRACRGPPMRRTQGMGRSMPLKRAAAAIASQQP